MSKKRSKESEETNKTNQKKTKVDKILTAIKTGNPVPSLQDKQESDDKKGLQCPICLKHGASFNEKLKRHITDQHSNMFNIIEAEGLFNRIVDVSSGEKYNHFARMIERVFKFNVSSDLVNQYASLVNKKFNLIDCEDEDIYNKLNSVSYNGGREYDLKNLEVIKRFSEILNRREQEKQIEKQILEQFKKKFIFGMKKKCGFKILIECLKEQIKDLPIDSEKLKKEVKKKRENQNVRNWKINDEDLKIAIDYLHQDYSINVKLYLYSSTRLETKIIICNGVTEDLKEVYIVVDELGNYLCALNKDTCNSTDFILKKSFMEFFKLEKELQEEPLELKEYNYIHEFFETEESNSVKSILPSTKIRNDWSDVWIGLESLTGSTLHLDTPDFRRGVQNAHIVLAGVKLFYFFTIPFELPKDMPLPFESAEIGDQYLSLDRNENIQKEIIDILQNKRSYTNFKEMGLEIVAVKAGQGIVFPETMPHGTLNFGPFVISCGQAFKDSDIIDLMSYNTTDFIGSSSYSTETIRKCIIFTTSEKIQSNSLNIKSKSEAHEKLSWLEAFKNINEIQGDELLEGAIKVIEDHVNKILAQ